MYLLAVKHGFTGGKVCEPSFGKGVFFDVLIANGISQEDLFGFEIFKPNFDFVKEKYPNATLIDHNFEYEFAKDDKVFKRDGIIINETFKKTQFDLFIGNPPYGSHESPYSYLFDKDAQVRYEGFFIMLALQQLKKGGLCVFIINSLWLNNGNMYNKQKEMIAKYGELIDSYRLPNNIFKGENRDTSIATDIVVFKKY
jgi:type I restriction-modification system DNA methylase subunit